MKKEKEIQHYIDSVLYSMDLVLKCFNLRGVQFFNELNIGITSEQFIVLDTIYCNDGIYQRDLSKLVLKDRSNTTRILNVLEKNGFVERSVGTQKNRLVKNIFITQKGKNMIDDNMHKLHEAFSELFDDVSEEEFVTLRKLLDKFNIALSKNINLQI